jgi:hypothetical protein
MEMRADSALRQNDAPMQKLQVCVERMEVEKRHVVQCARPIVDGRTVPVLSRIGVRNPGGQWLARQGRNQSAHTN